LIRAGAGVNFTRIDRESGSKALSKPIQKTRQWVRPEVKKLEAGSAESNSTGIDDGGPLGNARS
jgi:hypothetical protein